MCESGVGKGKVGRLFKKVWLSEKKSDKKRRYSIGCAVMKEGISREE